jgi:transcriptional regulator with XRE-family HTH domain
MTIVDLLKKELEARSRKNPSYSLRAFARALRINAATLSLILNQRRKITPRTAAKLLKELDLKPYRKKELIAQTLAGYDAGPDADEYPALAKEVFEAIGGWEHYAILALTEVKGFQSSSFWIAKRLNLPTDRVISALSRLESLGLIKKSGKQWKPTHKRFTFGFDVPNSTLRKAHREYIEKSLYSLDHHPVEARDFSGITLAIPKKRLPEAKERIKEFRRSLSEFLEEEGKDEVYRLNIQLFPLGK